MTDRARAARPTVSTGSKYEFQFGYSRAIRAGNVIHVAGTAGLTEDGTVVSDDVVEQMRRALEVVGKALSDLGGSLEDVVRTKIYVANERDIEFVALVHGEAFRDIRPASTIVKVGFVDPKILVEIEAEAVVDPAQ